MKYTNVRLKYCKDATTYIDDTIQHVVEVGLASVLGHSHVKCNNKRVDLNYIAKEICLKSLELNSLYASSIEQALPTGEISVCDDPGTGLADVNFKIYLHRSANGLCPF